MDWNSCIRYICCVRKKHVYKNEDVEESKPIIVSSPFYEYNDDKENPVENVKEKISSVYKKMSSWSLPDKPVKLNLFTLNQDDIRELHTHYEQDSDEDSPYEGDLDSTYKDTNFDDVVDEKIDYNIGQ